MINFYKNCITFSTLFKILIFFFFQAPFSLSYCEETIDFQVTNPKVFDYFEEDQIVNQFTACNFDFLIFGFLYENRVACKFLNQWESEVFSFKCFVSFRFLVKLLYGSGNGQYPCLISFQMSTTGDFNYETAL